MSSNLHKHIFLADDDKDDCLFFKDAIEELQLPVELTIVNDGDQLMQRLSEMTTNLPHALFLDLNMPRKSGFMCLSEIKSSQALASIPVIVFSTSYEPTIAESLYEKGAHFYICKPADFGELKKVINEAFNRLQEAASKPPKEKFLISKPKTKL